MLSNTQPMLLDYFTQPENFMSRKKVSSSIEVVLSVDDKRKFASFFVLLIAIDRRENKKRASADAQVAMADRSKKKSKPARQKYDKLGSHIDPLTGLLSGPFFILPHTNYAEGLQDNVSFPYDRSF